MSQNNIRLFLGGYDSFEECVSAILGMFSIIVKQYLVLFDILYGSFINFYYLLLIGTYKSYFLIFLYYLVLLGIGLLVIVIGVAIFLVLNKLYPFFLDWLDRIVLSKTGFISRLEMWLITFVSNKVARTSYWEFSILTYQKPSFSLKKYIIFLILGTFWRVVEYWLVAFFAFIRYIMPVWRVILTFFFEIVKKCSNYIYLAYLREKSQQGVVIDYYKVMTKSSWQIFDAGIIVYKSYRYFTWFFREVSYYIQAKTRVTGGFFFLVVVYSVVFVFMSLLFFILLGCFYYGVDFTDMRRVALRPLTLSFYWVYDFIVVSYFLGKIFLFYSFYKVWLSLLFVYFNCLLFYQNFLYDYYSFLNGTRRLVVEYLSTVQTQFVYEYSLIGCGYLFFFFKLFLAVLIFFSILGNIVILGVGLRFIWLQRKHSEHVLEDDSFLFTIAQIYAKIFNFLLVSYQVRRFRPVLDSIRFSFTYLNNVIKEKEFTEFFNLGYEMSWVRKFWVGFGVRLNVLQDDLLWEEMKRLRMLILSSSESFKISEEDIPEDLLSRYKYGTKFLVEEAQDAFIFNFFIRVGRIFSKILWNLLDLVRYIIKFILVNFGIIKLGLYLLFWLVTIFFGFMVRYANFVIEFYNRFHGNLVFLDKGQYARQSLFWRFLVRYGKNSGLVSLLLRRIYHPESSLKYLLSSLGMRLLVGYKRQGKDVIFSASSYFFSGFFGFFAELFRLVIFVRSIGFGFYEALVQGVVVFNQLLELLFYKYVHMGFGLVSQFAWEVLYVMFGFPLMMTVIECWRLGCILVILFRDLVYIHVVLHFRLFLTKRVAWVDNDFLFNLLVLILCWSGVLCIYWLLVFSSISLRLTRYIPEILITAPVVCSFFWLLVYSRISPKILFAHLKFSVGSWPDRIYMFLVGEDERGEEAIEQLQRPFIWQSKFWDDVMYTRLFNRESELDVLYGEADSYAGINPRRGYSYRAGFEELFRYGSWWGATGRGTGGGNWVWLAEWFPDNEYSRMRANFERSPTSLQDEEVEIDIFFLDYPFILTWFLFFFIGYEIHYFDFYTGTSTSLSSQLFRSWIEYWVNLFNWYDSGVIKTLVFGRSIHLYQYKKWPSLESLYTRLKARYLAFDNILLGLFYKEASRKLGSYFNTFSIGVFSREGIKIWLKTKLWFIHEQYRDINFGFYSTWKDNLRKYWDYILIRPRVMLGAFIGHVFKTWFPLTKYTGLKTRVYRVRTSFTFFKKKSASWFNQNAFSLIKPYVEFSKFYVWIKKSTMAENTSRKGIRVVPGIFGPEQPSYRYKMINRLLHKEVKPLEVICRFYFYFDPSGTARFRDSNYIRSRFLRNVSTGRLPKKLSGLGLKISRRRKYDLSLGRFLVYDGFQSRGVVRIRYLTGFSPRGLFGGIEMVPNVWRNFPRGKGVRFSSKIYLYENPNAGWFEKASSKKEYNSGYRPHIIRKLITKAKISFKPLSLTKIIERYKKEAYNDFLYRVGRVESLSRLHRQVFVDLGEGFSGYSQSVYNKRRRFIGSFILNRMMRLRRKHLRSRRRKSKLRFKKRARKKRRRLLKGYKRKFLRLDTLGADILRFYLKKKYRMLTGKLFRSRIQHLRQKRPLYSAWRKRLGAYSDRYTYLYKDFSYFLGGFSYGKIDRRITASKKTTFVKKYAGLSERRSLNSSKNWKWISRLRRRDQLKLYTLRKLHKLSHRVKNRQRHKSNKRKKGLYLKVRRGLRVAWHYYSRASLRIIKGRMFDQHNWWFTYKGWKVISRKEMNAYLGPKKKSIVRAQLRLFRNRTAKRFKKRRKARRNRPSRKGYRRLFARMLKKRVKLHSRLILLNSYMRRAHFRFYEASKGSDWLEFSRKFSKFFKNFSFWPGLVRSPNLVVSPYQKAIFGSPRRRGNNRRLRRSAKKVRKALRIRLKRSYRQRLKVLRPFIKVASLTFSFRQKFWGKHSMYSLSRRKSGVKVKTAPSDDYHIIAFVFRALYGNLRFSNNMQNITYQMFIKPFIKRTKVGSVSAKFVSRTRYLAWFYQRFFERYKYGVAIEYFRHALNTKRLRKKMYGQSKGVRINALPYFFKSYRYKPAWKHVTRLSWYPTFNRKRRDIWRFDVVRPPRRAKWKYRKVKFPLNSKTKYMKKVLKKVRYRGKRKVYWVYMRSGFSGGFMPSILTGHRVVYPRARLRYSRSSHIRNSSGFDMIHRYRVSRSWKLHISLRLKYGFLNLEEIKRRFKLRVVTLTEAERIIDALYKKHYDLVLCLRLLNKGSVYSYLPVVESSNGVMVLQKLLFYFYSKQVSNVDFDGVEVKKIGGILESFFMFCQKQWRLLCLGFDRSVVLENWYFFYINFIRVLFRDSFIGNRGSILSYISYSFKSVFVKFLLEVGGLVDFFAKIIFSNAFIFRKFSYLLHKGLVDGNLIALRRWQKWQFFSVYSKVLEDSTFMYNEICVKLLNELYILFFKYVRVGFTLSFHKSKQFINFLWQFGKVCLSSVKAFVINFVTHSIKRYVVIVLQKFFGFIYHSFLVAFRPFVVVSGYVRRKLRKAYIYGLDLNGRRIAFLLNRNYIKGLDLVMMRRRLVALRRKQQEQRIIRQIIHVLKTNRELKNLWRISEDARFIQAEMRTKYKLANPASVSHLRSRTKRTGHSRGFLVTQKQKTVYESLNHWVGLRILGSKSRFSRRKNDALIKRYLQNKSHKKQINLSSSRVLRARRVVASVHSFIRRVLGIERKKSKGVSLSSWREVARFAELLYFGYKEPRQVVTKSIRNQARMRFLLGKLSPEARQYLLRKEQLREERLRDGRSRKRRSWKDWFRKVRGTGK